MAIDDECVKTSEILSLESIRSTLIRQEETIIFALIERAQFRQNAVVYQKGGFGDLGCPLGSKEVAEQLSFLEYMLMGTVSLRNVVGCAVY
jgi:chorismate mutase